MTERSEVTRLTLQYLRMGGFELLGRIFYVANRLSDPLLKGVVITKEFLDQLTAETECEGSEVRYAVNFLQALGVVLAQGDQQVIEHPEKVWSTNQPIPAW